MPTKLFAELLRRAPLSAGPRSSQRAVTLRRGARGALLAAVAVVSALATPGGAAAMPGDLLVADREAFGGTGGVMRVDPQSGARATVSANGAPAGGPAFQDPGGVALAADGAIMVADRGAFGGTGGVIRVDPQSGARTTVSANGAPAGGPSFVDPNGVALAANGDILVVDMSAFGGTGGVIRVDPQSGARTTVSANGAPAGGPVFAQPAGIALAADGSILVTNGSPAGVIRVDPQSGARTTVSANGAPAVGPGFGNPYGLAVAANGDILVADYFGLGGSGAVIEVDPQTGARTVVSATGWPGGGPELIDPLSLAVAANGELLVADWAAFGGTGGVIRLDPQSGARTTVSATGAPAGGPSFARPVGIAVEPQPPAEPAVPAAPAAPPAPLPPEADALAPRLSGLFVSNRRFRVGRAATPLGAARVPVGTRIGFVLSEPATLKIQVERAVPGRRVGGRCLRPRPALSARPRCTRFVAVGKALTRQGRAGSNQVAFSGRIGRRALAAGRYRARLTATDAAGNRSPTHKLGFRVVRP